MKVSIIFAIAFVLFLLGLNAHANSPGSVGVRAPVPIAPFVLNTSSTNVTTGAWVEFVAAASMPYACSAVQIHNTGAQAIKLGAGAAASEVETGILFPVGVSVLMPVSLKRGVRLSVRSVSATQSSGFLTMSCFQ